MSTTEHGRAMNAEAAQCDKQTIRKKRGKDNVVIAANRYMSMEDEDSDRGENSDDLFSDCEERKNITCYSPNVSRVNDSTISNLSASSLLHSNHQNSTPAAVVPNTPLSLLPFLTKVSEQWTSDLETPQADKTAAARTDHSVPLLDSGEKAVSQKLCTPPISNVKNMDSQTITASPVINCKRVRNRTKRRIFRSAVVGSPPGSIASGINDLTKQNETEQASRCTEANVNCKDNNGTNACLATSSSGSSIEKSINTSPVVKCQNTSTQNFFSNASFTDMDEICESNLIKNSGNSVELRNENKNEICKGGLQKIAHNIDPNQANPAGYSYTHMRSVAKCTDQRIENINTRKKVQKINNKDIVVKVADVRFNSSIDTQDWFINESELNQIKHVSAVKPESNDSEDMGNVDTRNLSKDENENPFYGFTSADKSVAETKSLCVNKLIDNLKATEVSKENIKSEKCTVQNDNSDIFSTTGSKCTLPSNKDPSKTKLPFGSKFTDPVKDAELFIQPQTNRNKVGKDDDFCGFSTASGKYIAPSDKALSKASIFLADESADNVQAAKSLLQPQEINEKIRKLNDPCFLSASGKSIPLSDEAVLKAKRLFANDILDNKESLEPFVESSNMRKTKEKNSINFTTAMGQCMKISDKALSKAKTLFTDELEVSSAQALLINECANSIEKPEMSVQQAPSKPNIEGEHYSSGFSIARGKSIAPSHKALSNAKTLFADEFTDNVEAPESFAQPPNIVTTVEKIGNSCVSTASSKSTQLSEISRNKALSKGKRLFADDILDNNESFEAFKPPLKKEKLTETDSISFTTAKGQCVKVSETVLSRAKHLFADELEASVGQALCPNESTDNGFSTASGKFIVPSQKALSSAKTLFVNEFTDNVEALESFVKPPNVEEPVGKIGDSFVSTASSKSMQLSEICRNKPLAKRKKLLADDILDDNESFGTFKQPLKKQKLTETDLINFTNVKGQPLKISQKALSKARNLFADELEISSGQAMCPNESTDSGFSTASGKFIVPSEKALSKAETLFANDILHVDKISERDTIKPNVYLEPIELQIKSDIEMENEESFRYSTPSGIPQNTSDKANFEPKALFLKDLNRTSEMQSSSTVILDQKVPTVSKTKGSCNVDGQSAVSKDTPTRSEFESAHMRSVKDSDDDTPLGRRSTSNSKKSRFSDECQGRKLFSDESHVATETKQHPTKQSLDEHGKNSAKIDNTVPDEEIGKQCNVVVKSLSDELAASALALLADETCDNNVKNWTSEAEKKMAVNSLCVSSCTSPVLGRPSTLQRRGRRKTTVGSSNVNVSDIKQNMVSSKLNLRFSDSAYCGKMPQLEVESTLQNCASSGSANSNEFADTQLLIDFIDKTTNISEKRVAAALEQDKIIQAKKIKKPRRSASTLQLYKETNENNRISWKKLTNGTAPTLINYKEAVYQKISPEILKMTPETAETYRFRCVDFYGNSIVETNVNGLDMEDGARLILDENGYVGLPEMSRAFMASPGIDPALLPEGWITNHYRWIIWKLAAMDRAKFASIRLPRALTPARVMEQLRYRYDREIDKSQRPALRRILEKDDAASKRMILCVSSLVECKNAEVIGKSPCIAVAMSWKMVLTDGWYSVPACIDLSMINNIASGKVREGTKLLIHGAELLNSDQGSSPLEIPSDVCLKIHTNSTRRAKWHAKMGFSPCPGPIPVKLRSICAHGGLIGKISVTIVRTYPLLYHEKTSTGESIFRNVRCEEKAILAYEQECTSKMEALSAETEKCFSTGKKHVSTDADSMDFLAAELSEGYQKLTEEEVTSKQQRENLLNQCWMKEQEFKQKLVSKLQENLPPQRKVSSVLKLRVADEEKCAILTVWSPSDDVIDILKEGNRVLMCSVNASGKRADELQLTAGRSTVFKLESKNTMAYPNRISIPLSNIAEPTFNPVYGEVDTVGLIVSIENAPYGIKNFESVNLARPRKHSSDFSYLSILFWQGMVTYGYKEILTVGSLIACSNLEWRQATSASIPLLYCTERTNFTRNPRQAYLQKDIEALKTSIAEPAASIAKCAEEIGAELQKKLVFTRSPGFITPNRPILNITSQRSTGQNLGLNNSPSTTNPRSLSVQKRLEKLRFYGEPPELPPTIITTRSTRISLDFRSPVDASKVKGAKPK